MARTLTSQAYAVDGLHWLLRYARRSGVQLDGQEQQAMALRSHFAKPAWRLLCRSGRHSFLPILRNRKLSFDSLVHYTQTLAQSGFQVAPRPELLGYLIQSSYYYFDRMPEVPDDRKEMTLLRLANRHGAVSQIDFQRVHEWLSSARAAITTRMTWATLLRRANERHQRQMLVVNCAKAEGKTSRRADWPFACKAVAWQGYEIVPLVNEIDLWDEAQAMVSCLYRLRGVCNHDSSPSRFFSVRKNGRRHATLELVYDLVVEQRSGPAQNSASWQLQDCRLSHNRLPAQDLIQALVDFGEHYNSLSKLSATGPLRCQGAES